jgi:hypothetical protein
MLPETPPLNARKGGQVLTMGEMAWSRLFSLRVMAGKAETSVAASLLPKSFAAIPGKA